MRVGDHAIILHCSATDIVRPEGERVEIVERRVVNEHAEYAGRWHSDETHSWHRWTFKNEDLRRCE